MSFDFNRLLEKSNSKISDSVSGDEESIIEKYKLGEYRIVTEQARYPLANLKEIFKSYNLRPDYQRRRVWDNKRKSKLIESFIINVPIPPIFLYEYDFSKYEVMDGLQRISAILDYFEGKFELEGLDLWSELNGKKYSQLPDEIKTGIERRYLSGVILLKETASNIEKEKMMKQFVFERLNTGGMELSPQEIRNALHLGEFNEQLIKMAESVGFRELWGKLDNESYSRMEDCELVLRFFAYKSALKLNISKSTKVLLDSYAEIAKDLNKEEVVILREFFYDTLQLVKHLFGEMPFTSSQNSDKSEKMIYDAVMLSCAELIEENLKNDLYKLKEGSFSNLKYVWIKEDSQKFYGKYTSMKNVGDRVDIFKGRILENIK